MSNQNGSFQWAHALMAVDITTILIRSRADAMGVPVDIYVPGCPPTAVAGLRLQKRLKKLLPS